VTSAAAITLCGLVGAPGEVPTNRTSPTCGRPCRQNLERPGQRAAEARRWVPRNGLLGGTGRQSASGV
jgi:hypothetical protein